MILYAEFEMNETNVQLMSCELKFIFMHFDLRRPIFDTANNPIRHDTELNEFKLNYGKLYNTEKYIFLNISSIC